MPLKYAAPWKRGAAFLVDAAMVLPVAALSPLSAVGLLALTGTLFEASPWQATPGKRWLGLRVMEAEGRRMTWRRAAVRHVARAVPLALLAGGEPVSAAVAAVFCVVPVLTGARRSTLWDRLAFANVIAPPVGAWAASPHGD